MTGGDEGEGEYPEAYRRRRPFTMAGARGLRGLYDALRGAYGDWLVLPEALFTLRELDPCAPDVLAAGALTIRSRPVAHIETSIGYRVETPDGTTVAYSGDTGPCESLVELARGVDLFLCECSLPDEMKVERHMTPSEAGETASRAGVKHLALTHFYPECDGADNAAQCRKTGKGPLTLAGDLMRIRI